MTEREQNSLGPGPRHFIILTGNLRWNNGVLEQEHAYQDFENYELVGSRSEWRPVPTVAADDT